MSNTEIARALYEAFCEGYNSYETPANAYNTIEDAWDKSDAKKLAKSLVEAKGDGHADK